MLKHQDAARQLEQWRTSKGGDGPIARVSGLPANLRNIGHALFRHDADGKKYRHDRWQECEAFRREQSRVLEGLSKRDRNKLFKKLCGPLAPATDQAWERLKVAPYQSGYCRRSFRAPHNPEMSLERRFGWLGQIADVANAIDADVLTLEWLAAWCPYLSGYNTPNACAHLFAAAIDAGGAEGETVFEVLRASATNEHEVGAMGRHVPRALLCAAREDGWELIEKMLLAAQRQEGLRQVILETVDEAHPHAFQRMLRLIIDEKLARFSSVARAVDVWFGMNWDSASVKTINDTVRMALELLESDAAWEQAVNGSDPEAVFLGLWADGFEDVEHSIETAGLIAEHSAPEVRFVTAYHLGQTGLAESQEHLIEFMDDPDLRVAIQAMHGADRCARANSDVDVFDEPRFAALERLFERCPAKHRKLDRIVWPWTEQKLSRDLVATAMVNSIGKLPPSRLIPYIEQFDPRNRSRACQFLSEQKKWSHETRETLVRLMGDSSTYVRASAFDAFECRKLTPAEAETMEGFLTRKANDLRQGAVKLLIGQDDDSALASGRRLIAAGNVNQRVAGLETLRELAEADRRREDCLELVQEYESSRKKLTKDEQVQLSAILTTGEEKVMLDNGLGLFNPVERSPRITPKKCKAQAVTPATTRIITDLDRLVHKHRDVSVPIQHWNRTEEEPLGGIRWFPGYSQQMPIREQIDRMPLHQVWLDWEKQRGSALKDVDGCELLRAHHLLELTQDWGWSRYGEKFLEHKSRRKLRSYIVGQGKLPKLKYPHVVKGVVDWLVHLHPPKNAVDVCLDVIETVLALIPESDLQELVRLRETPLRSRYSYRYDDPITDWRETDMLEHWMRAPEGWLLPEGDQLPRNKRTRLWNLQRWFDEPLDGARRNRAPLSSVLAAYSAGAATIADVFDEIIGPDQDFVSLRHLTLSGESRETLEQNPELPRILDQVRTRILEVELVRGDLPTPATTPASVLNSLYGLSTLKSILLAIGKERFRASRYSWRQEEAGRIESFTHLVRVTHPGPADTADDFKREMKQALKDGSVPEEKVLQLVFLAPQWTRFVQEFYNWDGLDEGLYWFLAHMRYVSGTEEAALAAGFEDEEQQSEDGDRPRRMSAWERLILERTPITAEQRNNGVVDVNWFHRTHDRLGRKRWLRLAEAARFAATGAQAKRAQFIADVLLGNVARQELIDGIRERRLKEHVRLLGLLPLAKGNRAERDLHERYAVLQDYKRYAKGLSSMSRPDALLAVEIGLQNLAQLAGYKDPLRLEWAMEAKATKDLLDGPVTVSKGDVSMNLSLDDRAQPQIEILRGSKSLKSLPAAVKKETDFVDLKERHRELKRQASLIRGSLEAAMCRGDSFTGGELAEIAGHALLKPMLERLVLVGDGAMGYPDKNGKALRGHDGRHQTVKKRDQLRIAHPSDMLAAKDWDKWQHECFQAERLQPFKQIFRELYIVTAQERSDKTFSRRYAGQQVNPQQAYTLWGQRGWNVDEGVFKVFHDEQISVAVDFDYGITTPLDVEGLTLDTVQFFDERHRQLKLTDVPARIFSEVMRDLDLVVSVAHRGGVDPEATASTVEMRSALLRETCDLLGLRDVRLKKSQASIKGHLGDYTVHLGSATVHRLPGGAVCMVPVHAQHRGRLFLPFADDDPKTAEVISKVLLLAKDDEIQDPTILEQLRGMAS
jgi:hypothetical protein